MLKLMIVDDEAVIRMGMRYSIPWEELGIQVAAEACNGLDACDKAIRIQPDIVLTDIKMPIMDGISFIRHVKDRLPYTHFVLLSGYSDVSFLKQAISLGVADYIFKTADSDEIISTMKKTAALIIDEQAARHRLIQRDNLLDENRTVIQSALIRDLLTSSPPHTCTNVLSKLEGLGIVLSGPQFVILGFVYRPGYEWELAREVSIALSDYRPLICPFESSLLIAVLNLQDSGGLFSRIEELHVHCSQLLESGTPAVLSELCSAPESLASIFGPICNSVDILFWFDDRKVLYTNMLPKISPPKRNELAQHESTCLLAFAEKDVACMQVALYDYFDFLRNRLVPHREFIESITRLLASLSAFDHNDALLDFLSEIEGQHYSEIFKKIAALLFNNTPALNTGALMVEKAQQYIGDHITETITLNQVAGLLYVSPSYLSRLFKEKTGKGFKEYLYAQRVDRAKELLLDSSLKTYEVATRSGFRDYKHFSCIFLKLCGYSAREYRNRHLHNTY